jgi:hypothetical protein
MAMTKGLTERYYTRGDAEDFPSASPVQPPKSLTPQEIKMNTSRPCSEREGVDLHTGRRKLLKSYCPSKLVTTVMPQRRRGSGSSNKMRTV